MRVDKFFLFFIVSFFSLNTVFSQSSANPQPKYLIRFATEVPADSSWNNTLKAINRELYLSTNKEVGIVIYPGGVMGDQGTVITKMATGQITGSTFSNAGLQRIYKDFAIVGFPLVISNETEYDIFKDKLSGFFEKKLEESNSGVVILAWTETGPIYVCSKMPLNSIDTMRASKPFVLEGDRVSMALFTHIKANPRPLQTSDILQSLSTGLIDTVFAPPYGLIAMQWTSRVNYIADFPITFMIGAIGIEKKYFNALPKEHQLKVREIFKKHFDALTPTIRQDNKAALETIKKFGIRFLNVEQKEQKEFYRVCNEVNLQMIEKDGYSKDIYDMLLKNLNKK